LKIEYRFSKVFPNKNFKKWMKGGKKMNDKDENGKKDEGMFGGIRKAFHHAVFVDEEVPGGKPSETSTNQQEQGAAETAPPVFNAGVVKKPAEEVKTNCSKVDPQIYETLQEAIGEKGSAFTKFMEMLKTFEDVIGDELTRYKSAMKAVNKTGGITLEQILKAIETRVSALQAEREKFNSTLTERGSNIDSMTAELKAKEDDIIRHQAEIDRLKKEQDKIKGNVAKEKARIEEVRANFDVTVNALEEEHTQAKEKITNYLKGGN
jgi:hypothetical protein